MFVAFWVTHALLVNKRYVVCGLDLRIGHRKCLREELQGRHFISHRSLCIPQESEIYFDIWLLGLVNFVFVKARQIDAIRAQILTKPGTSPSKLTQESEINAMHSENNNHLRWANRVLEPDGWLTDYRRQGKFQNVWKYVFAFCQHCATSQTI